MGVFIDLKGKIFGSLVVIKRVPKDGRTNAFWMCRCKCGEIIIVSGNRLRKGHTSCRKCKKPSNLKHGMASSPEYEAWTNMKRRCNDSKLEHYHNYGGRGIIYDPSWEKFESFFKDMGKRPSPKHTLERKNNDSNYCKDNCIWATRKEQANNQRKTILLELNGETKCLRDWAKYYKIDYGVAYRRLKRGIAPMLAFTHKAVLRSMILLNGEIISFREAERKLGLKKGTIANRKRAGFTDEEATTLPPHTQKRKSRVTQNYKLFTSPNQ